MPFGPAGRLLFTLLGTDAAWKVLEKAIDTVPKVLRPPGPAAPHAPDATCAGHRELETEVRRQNEALVKLGATMEEMAAGLRPIVVRVTIALWLAIAALVVSVAALIVAIRH
jgi:hypothetical protein